MADAGPKAGVTRQPGTPVGSERPRRSAASASASTGPAAAAAAAVDVPMPDAEVDDDMGQVEHCPVSSCHASRADLHAGWQSLGSLRVHVDAHLLGALPGMPPQEWLQRHNLAICPKLCRPRCCAFGAWRQPGRASPSRRASGLG